MMERPPRAARLLAPRDGEVKRRNGRKSKGERSKGERLAYGFALGYIY
jgi:hypothetical protein